MISGIEINFNSGLRKRLKTVRIDPAISSIFQSWVKLKFGTKRAAK